MADDKSNVPTLTEVSTVALSATRQRKVYAGTTNGNGAARLNAALSDGGRYHYAVAVTVFEVFNGVNEPTGVGGAVIAAEGLVIAPLEVQAGILQTSVLCVVQARQRAPVQGDISSHPVWAGALPVAAIVDYELG